MLHAWYWNRDAEGASMHQALDASTLEALQPAAALGAACEFLAAARRAEPAKARSRACAERDGLVQRCVTVLNMLGARLQALDPPIARTPAFQVSSKYPKPYIRAPIRVSEPAQVFQHVGARLQALYPPIARTPAFQVSNPLLWSTRPRMWQAGVKEHSATRCRCGRWIHS